jgi:integrase
MTSMSDLPIYREANQRHRLHPLRVYRQPYWGHSSIAVTGDIYGHTSDATTRAAVHGLTDALGI